MGLLAMNRINRRAKNRILSKEYIINKRLRYEVRGRQVNGLDGKHRMSTFRFTVNKKIVHENRSINKIINTQLKNLEASSG